MAKIVIGIIGTCEPSRVEQTIASSGLDRTQVRVLTAEDETPGFVNSPISFIHVASGGLSRDMSDDMTRGTGVLSDFGGMAVPGINNVGGSLDAFLHPAVLDHLDGFNLPGGDADRYNDAIDDGRCVAIVTCDDGAEQSALQALQKAGLQDVKIF